MATSRNYKGVRFDERFSVYQGSIRLDAKTRYLGNYATEAEAAYSVHFAQSLKLPDIPPVNAAVGETLSPEQRVSIEKTVVRLLNPDRIPRTRKERIRYA